MEQLYYCVHTNSNVCASIQTELQRSKMVQYSDSSGDENEAVKEKGSVTVKSNNTFQVSPQMQEFNAKIRFKYRGMDTQNLKPFVYYVNHVVLYLQKNKMLIKTFLRYPADLGSWRNADDHQKRKRRQVFCSRQ